MNERSESELQTLILRLKEKQKSEHPKALLTYMFELRRDFIEISDEAILESIQVYNDNEEMYSEKPLRYFIAIVKNKEKERQSQINKEGSINSGIPNNNLGGK